LGSLASPGNPQGLAQCSFWVNQTADDSQTHGRAREVGSTAGDGTKRLHRLGYGGVRLLPTEYNIPGTLGRGSICVEDRGRELGVHRMQIITQGGPGHGLPPVFAG
jgi:hypothetical protein